MFFSRMFGSKVNQVKEVCYSKSVRKSRKIYLCRVELLPSDKVYATALLSFFFFFLVRANINMHISGLFESPSNKPPSSLLQTGLREG